VAAKRTRGGPFEALRPLKEELARKGDVASSKKAKPTTGEGRVLAASRMVAPSRAESAQVSSESENDEALLLHRSFAGVRPLDRARGRVTRQIVERSEAVERAATRMRDSERTDADVVHEHLRALIDGQARFEVEDDGRNVEGRRLDLPRDALRRLRRGLLPIDARLDLHGLRVERAREQLESFLRMTRARGERCVLVVHGKGDHSPGGLGVLRGEMAAWLSQGAASEHVAGFATATGHDGGHGAVYVLLRR